MSISFHVCEVCICLLSIDAIEAKLLQFLLVDRHVCLCAHVPGMPRLEPPHSPQGSGPYGQSRGKGGSLRESMLKGPDDRPSPSDPPPSCPSPDSHGPSPDSRFHRWSPFSKVREHTHEHPLCIVTNMDRLVMHNAVCCTC